MPSRDEIKKRIQELENLAPKSMKEYDEIEQEIASLLEQLTRIEMTL